MRPATTIALALLLAAIFVAAIVQFAVLVVAGDLRSPVPTLGRRRFTTPPVVERCLLGELSGPPRGHEPEGDDPDDGADGDGDREVDQEQPGRLADGEEDQRQDHGAAELVRLLASSSPGPTPAPSRRGPSVATAGATQRIITPTAGSARRSGASPATPTTLATTAKATNPIHDTAMAGRNAPSSLAMNRSRSEIGRCSSALERAPLLLAGEGVGGQHGRHHQRHDQEQRREQVADDEHEQLLLLGQRRRAARRSWSGIDSRRPPRSPATRLRAAMPERRAAARPAAAPARAASGSTTAFDRRTALHVLVEHGPDRRPVRRRRAQRPDHAIAQSGSASRRRWISK